MSAARPLIHAVHYVFPGGKGEMRIVSESVEAAERIFAVEPQAPAGSKIIKVVVPSILFA